MERPAFCVTCYCGSNRVHPVYHEAARTLGQGIGGEGWRLVYGGNYAGLMADVADGVRDGGGSVVGVSPPLFGDVNDDRCDEFVVADDMRHRKAEMARRADAFLALPGGIGTLEEFFETLVGRHLRVHDKPVILLDVEGYYQPLVAWLRTATRAGFVRERAWDDLVVAEGVEAAMTILRQTAEAKYADSSASVVAAPLKTA